MVKEEKRRDLDFKLDYVVVLSCRFRQQTGDFNSPARLRLEQPSAVQPGEAV
jgi:hypothetical protein